MCSFCGKRCDAADWTPCLASWFAAELWSTGDTAPEPAWLGPTLQGLELVDDVQAVHEPIWDGLGLVKFSIAPHYRSDHPESESIEELVRYFSTESIPHRTLRDGQALVVSEDTSHVVEWSPA